MEVTIVTVTAASYGIHFKYYSVLLLATKARAINIKARFSTTSRAFSSVEAPITSVTPTIHITAHVATHLVRQPINKSRDTIRSLKAIRITKVAALKGRIPPNNEPETISWNSPGEVNADNEFAKKAQAKPNRIKYGYVKYFFMPKLYH